MNNTLDSSPTDHSPSTQGAEDVVDSVERIHSAHEGERVASDCINTYITQAEQFSNDLFLEHGVIKERKDFIGHAHRVKEIVHTYADGTVADATYHAALLHDLVDRLGLHDRSEIGLKLRSILAATQLIEYFTNPDVDTIDANFTLHLLAELNGIEVAAEKSRADLSVGSDKQLSAIMQGHLKGKIEDKALWSSELPTLDIEHLKEQAAGNNVESIIIKAAEAIDNLMKPAPTDTALLQDIIEAETFYAPLCEVWGLDAMAMKLRSEATKRRFEKLGKHDILQRAEMLQRKAMNSGFLVRLPGLFGAESIDYSYAPNATHGLSEHPSFYSGTLRGGEFDGAEIRIRVKSIGSIAKKIDSDKPEYRDPLDIVGVTIISDNYEQNAARFAHAVEMVRTSDKVTLEAAPSKKKPLYVQGNPEYVQDVVGRVGEEDLPLIQPEEIKHEENPHPYRVAKMTGRYNSSGVPFEVQFLADSDKKAARIGMQAHVIFKLMKYNKKSSDKDYKKLVKLLEEIYERKHHIDPTANNVNKRSPRKAEALAKDLDSILAAGFAA